MLEFISSDNGIIKTKAGNIVLKKKSPLFGNESIEGEITFPFTIPMTDQLRRWLDFPDRIEAVNQSPIKRIQLKRNGHPILTGDLKLGDADSDQVETTLVTGSSPFAALIKDICLDELDLGFQTFADEAALLAYWNASLAGNVYTHPYYLPTIWSDNTGHLNTYLRASSTYDLSSYNAPMLYYSWLLPKLFESLGYEFEDRVFINNENLREMLFFSMHNVSNQEDPLTIHYNNLLPHYKLSTWLIEIQNAFFVRFLFDNNKNKVTLVWLTDCLNNASNAKTVYHKKTKVKAKDKIVSSFSYNLIDSQAIWEPTNENLLPAVWMKKDLPNPANHPNKFCYVASEDNLYWFYYDTNLLKYVSEVIVTNYWKGMRIGGYYGRMVTGFQIGDNSAEMESFTSNIHPLHTQYPSGNLENKTYLEEDKKLISPYVLFAQHQVHETFNYALADFWLGDFSFIWHHKSWFLQNKVLPWLEFLKNAKAVEDTILLSDVDLANWDWTIPILIGNTPVLVDEMDIPLSAEGELMEVKVTGFRM